MKSLIKSIVLIFGLTITSYANEAIEVGSGMDSPSKNGSVKFLEYDGIATTDTCNFLGGIGYWWDTSNGAKDSLYLRSGLGMLVNPTEDGNIHHSEVYPSVYFGPAYVINTDQVLRTNFQWAFEGNLMMVDSRYIGIGICVKHFANAGFAKADEGRTFFGLRFQWR